MRSANLAKYLSTALAVALISSCMSSGSGGGITGSGIVIGSISGFGSIFVNGIEFDVSHAGVTIDGTTAAETDLRLGMVVQVRGTVDATAATGVASSVDFEHDLRGPVEAVDISASTIVVLGQVVLLSATTVFDGVTLASLVPGDIVEVSGFIDADANIRATRVELQEDGGDLDVKGLISDLDITAETCRVGGQLVDYTNAQIENAPAGGLANGLFVDVSSSQPLANGVLIADRVKVDSGSLDGEEGNEVEIDGIVSRVDSATAFVLDQTQPVHITATTEFEGGDATNIAVNVELQVKGRVDNTGSLVADKIEFD